MVQINEKQIIEQVLGGRTDAFGLLVDRYGRMVFAVVARIVCVQQDAEEVAQDVFVTAFRRLEQYDGGYSFGTWLCRIAHNAAISFLRKARRDRCLVDIDEATMAQVTDAMATETLSASGGDMKTLLRRAVDMLSADDRALVTMFYYEGCQLREIAYILDMPVDDKSVRTLATRICRIRKRLYIIIRKMEAETR